eukprot:TRINITY_DN1859_c0_g2_i2.p1 TRINITY_DN1859_c0_g2~~TRINITY_DN1859_c0_g2_i2.p1  ORF type:complete len:683 (+),score=137.25 TRINITY_DN1859_c0_g2_i2:44-2092(+)
MKMIRSCICLFAILCAVIGSETIQLSFIMKGVSYRPQLFKAANMTANLVNKDDSLLPNGQIQLNMVDLSLELDNLKVLAENMIEFPSFAGYLGPFASGTAVTIGNFAASLEIPVVSGTATSPVLSDKSMDDGYPYFVRTSANGGLSGLSNIHIMKNAGWKRVGVLSSSNTFGLGLSEYVVSLMEENGIQLVAHVTHPPYLGNSLEDVESSVHSALDELEAGGANVIFYHGNEGALIMRIAYERNMVGLQEDGTVYQWLLGDTACRTAMFTPANSYCLEACTEKIEEIKKAMRGTLCAAVNLNIDEDWLTNWDEATSEGMLTEDEIDESQLTSWAGGNRYPSTVYYYDAVMTFAHAIHNVCTDNLAVYDDSYENCYKDLRNRGEDILHAIRELNFEGASGDIAFDNQDRIFTMNLVSYRYDAENPDAFGFVPYALHSPITDKVETFDDPYYANLENSPPPDMTTTNLSSLFENLLMFGVVPLMIIALVFGIVLIKKYQKAFRGNIFLSTKTLLTIISLLMIWIVTRVFADFNTFNPGSLISVVVLFDVFSSLFLCVMISIVFSRVYRFRAVTINKKLSSIRFSKFHQLHTLLWICIIPIGVAALRLSPIFIDDVKLDSEFILQDNSPENDFKISQVQYESFISEKNSNIVIGLVILVCYMALLNGWVAYMAYSCISEFFSCFF